MIGRPPFQTKDVKAIYKYVSAPISSFTDFVLKPDLCRKIRDNSYAFPEDHSLSVEAVDLISWILRPNPTDRPTLSEILAHPWFVTGPFPSRISTRALDPERAVGLGEEWSRMSKRHAWDNFRKVKRAAGVVEVEGTGVGPVAPTVSQQQQQSQQQEQTHVPQMVSQALPIVAEAVEEDAPAAAAGVMLADPGRGGLATSSIPATRPVDALESMPGALPLQSGIKRSKSTMRIVRAEEEKDAKGRVEKEVRSATAPESPISELLRYATNLRLLACFSLFSHISSYRILAGPPASRCSSRPRRVAVSARRARRDRSAAPADLFSNVSRQQRSAALLPAPGRQARRRLFRPARQPVRRLSASPNSNDREPSAGGAARVEEVPPRVTEGTRCPNRAPGTAVRTRLGRGIVGLWPLPPPPAATLCRHHRFRRQRRQKRLCILPARCTKQRGARSMRSWPVERPQTSRLSVLRWSTRCLRKRRNTLPESLSRAGSTTRTSTARRTA